ncbi:hypothetical protein AMJ80_01985 [bacterium SM23_31]|nr:MAG: hypothetical protein AMJ80_01985 [bacterium SM23_31]
MPKKKPEECPPKGAPAFMTTYGDMMTLLLTFFVLLISFSSIQEAEFRRAIGSFRGALGVMPYEQSILESRIVPIPGLTNLQESEIMESIVEFQEAAAEMDIAEAVKLEITEEGIHITIGDTVLFESGEAKLKLRILPLLKQIADLASGWDNTIHISGHTDTDPISNIEFPSNWELSYARALEVGKDFMRNGIEEGKVFMEGLGEHHPIADNVTLEGKAKNRRVEIFIRYERETKIPEKVSQTIK